MATVVATLTGAETGLSDDALEALQAQLRGPALVPSDPAYGQVREAFNAMHAAVPLSSSAARARPMWSTR